MARYHFTDESPFVVTTAEGDVTLGKGWLAISEVEYQALTATHLPCEDTGQHREFPCEGGGGNDIIYCTECGVEWEYARSYGPPKPICPKLKEEK